MMMAVMQIAEVAPVIKVTNLELVVQARNTADIRVMTEIIIVVFFIILFTS